MKRLINYIPETKIKQQEIKIIILEAPEQPQHLVESYIVDDTSNASIMLKAISSAEISRNNQKLETLIKQFVAMKFTSSSLFEKAVKKLNTPSTIKKALISWQKISGDEILNLSELQDMVATFIKKQTLSYEEIDQVNNFLESEIKSQKTHNKTMKKLKKIGKQTKHKIRKSRLEEISLANRQRKAPKENISLENVLEKMIAQDKKIAAIENKKRILTKKINLLFATAMSNLINGEPYKNSQFSKNIQGLTLPEKMKTHLIFSQNLNSDMNDNEIKNFNIGSRALFKLNAEAKQTLLPLINHEVKIMNLYTKTYEITERIESQTAKKGLRHQSSMNAPFEIMDYLEKSLKESGVNLNEIEEREIKKSTVLTKKKPLDETNPIEKISKKRFSKLRNKLKRSKKIQH